MTQEIRKENRKKYSGMESWLRGLRQEQSCVPWGLGEGCAVMWRFSEDRTEVLLGCRDVSGT